MGKRNLNNIVKFITVFNICFLLIFSLTNWECSSSNNKSKMNKPSIKEVIEKHSRDIMSVPGVAGIYQGETKDGKPCIKIMVVKKTEEINKRIPKTLEGYPVIIDVTGVIKPMNQEEGKQQ